VLRRIFVPKRKEVTGEWKKLRNEETNDLHSSPNIIRKNEMGGAFSTYGGKKRCTHVGKPEARRPLGRPMSGWEDDIKMNLQEVRLICLRIGTGVGLLCMPLMDLRVS
jgi:hypothetical protein